MFSSSRKANSDALLDGRTAEAYSDLYIADFDSISGLYSNPRKMEGPLNSNRNDGSFSYNPDSQIGYTMKCNERKSNCIIMSAQYDEKTKTWEETDPLAINSNEHSVGHPVLMQRVMFYILFRICKVVLVGKISGNHKKSGWKLGLTHQSGE